MLFRSPRAGQHHHLRDARPGGGHDPGRPRGGDERRRGPAGGIVPSQRRACRAGRARRLPPAAPPAPAATAQSGHFRTA